MNKIRGFVDYWIYLLFFKKQKNIRFNGKGQNVIKAEVHCLTEVRKNQIEAI